MRLLVVTATVLCSLSGCRPSASQTPQARPGDGAQTEDGAISLPPPGPVLDATIPLLGGGSKPIADLQGRVVLLDVSSPQDEAWPATQQRFRMLAQAHGDSLRVVSVAVTSDAQTLRSAWDTDPPPFVLGWDPQAALALRLGLTPPSVIVLDAQGRELMRADAADQAELERVEQVVAAAVAATQS